MALKYTTMAKFLSKHAKFMGIILKKSKSTYVEKLLRRGEEEHWKEIRMRGRMWEDNGTRRSNAG